MECGFWKGLDAAQRGDFEAVLRECTPLAEQGRANAQTNLGILYYYGQGADQDNVYAYMWANMSAENGGENGARLPDLIAGRMTPSQIERAQDLGRECVAKDYKNC